MTKYKCKECMYNNKLGCTLDMHEDDHTKPTGCVIGGEAKWVEVCEHCGCDGSCGKDD